MRLRGLRAGAGTCLLVVVLPSLGLAADEEGFIGEAEAIESARAVARELGRQTEVQVGEAEPLRLKGTSVLLRSVRRVNAPGMAVWLDDETGDVVYVLSRFAYRVSEAAASVYAEAGIRPHPQRNADWARKTSAHFIEKILGSTLDCRFTGAQFDVDSSARWRVIWTRYLSGYPFPQETITVELHENPVRGHLVWLRNSVTDNTCPTDVKVAKEEALKTARLDAARQTGEADESREDDQLTLQAEPTLIIVYPVEADVEESGFRGPRPVSPRLVYYIMFAAKSSESSSAPKQQYIVWVDASSGEVVGTGEPVAPDWGPIVNAVGGAHSK